MNQQLPVNMNGTPASSTLATPAYDERPLGVPVDTNHFYSSEPDDENFDWQRFFSILRRRRKIAIAAFLATLALAALYIATTPRIYRTSASLLINTNKNQDSDLSEIPVLASLGAATSTRSQDTEVEIINSSTVTSAALDLLPKDVRKKLGEGYSTDVVPKRPTDVVTVSVMGRDPNAIVAFSNALCKAYQDQSQLNSTEQFRDAADWVYTQLKDVNSKLTAKQLELKRFKESHGIIDFGAETTNRATQLATLQTALQQTQADQKAAISALAISKSQISQMAPATIDPASIVTRPEVQQLKGQLITLETQRLTALQEFTPDSPEVKAYDDQILDLKQRLRTEARTEVGTYQRNVNPIRLTIQQKIADTQAQIWSNQSRLQVLQTNIAKAEDYMKTLPAEEFRLGQIMAEVATYQATAQSLNDKYQTLRISVKTPVSNARVLTPAVGATKISPRIPPTVMMAVIGGTLLAIVLALIVDGFDNRIYTEDDATRAAKLPVLAHIPVWETTDKSRLLINTADSSVLLESFRMLRTQLAFISSYGGMKSLVVTSSQPGEGKSTVSTNLAVALALNGKKVILVDADLRRPRVHTFFDIKNARGFTDIVAGECSIEDALEPTSIENLQILPSGPMPPNPPELLDSPKSREIIARLKTMADFVVIDAPPALVMADAQIAATMAEGVLLVVSCKEASRNAVERTVELMQQTGVKMVGMVLNKFSVQESGYYGYYGYAYSYSKYNLATSPEEADNNNQLNGSSNGSSNGTSNGSASNGSSGKKSKALKK